MPGFGNLVKSPCKRVYRSQRFYKEVYYCFARWLLSNYLVDNSTQRLVLLSTLAREAPSADL